MALEGTKALQAWCRAVTADYADSGVDVRDMSASWRDGMAFCALIHRFRPDLVDFGALDPADGVANCRLAFEAAERHLGIPALLDAEDVGGNERPPDRLSVLTYLSQFYQAFHGATAPSANRPPPKSSSKPSSAAASPALSPARKLDGASGRRAGAINDPCGVCAKPVFLLERMNVGGRLLHRTCFRCARCKSQLNVVSYYETEAGEYCCDVCPDEEASMAETVRANKVIVEKHLDDEEQDESDSSDSDADEKKEDSLPDDGAKAVVVVAEAADVKEDEVATVPDEAKSGSDAVSRTADKEGDDDDEEEEECHSSNKSKDDIVEKERVDEATDNLSAKKACEEDNEDDVQAEEESEAEAQEADDEPEGAQAKIVETEEIHSDSTEEFEIVRREKDESQEVDAADDDDGGSLKEGHSEPTSPWSDSPQEDAKTPDLQKDTLELPEGAAANTSESSSAVFESADDGEETAAVASSKQEGDNDDEEKRERKKSYPVEKNPFEDEDEEEDDATQQQEEDVAVETRDTGAKPKSTNPFGSDFEDSDEETTQSQQQQPPPKPPRVAVAAAAPQKPASLNPFGSDFEDDEEEESRVASPAPSSASSTGPQPRSRKKRQAPLPPGALARTTPTPSPRTSTRSLKTPASASSAGASSSPVPAPRHSLSPRPSPRPTRAAPPTPTTPSTMSARPPRPPPPDANKHRKELDNLNRRSQIIESQQKQQQQEVESIVLTPLSPDKAAVEGGQWKKKKGPAPPRPIPQKRQVKKLPRKAVNTELRDIEIKQQELERQGVKLETTIRELCDKSDTERREKGLKPEEGPDQRDSLGPEVEDLIVQLFDLVNEKNELFRRQTELMYMKRDHRLEEEHADIEHQIRVLMAKPDSQRTDDDKMKEERLIARLMEVVAGRNEIVDCLEMDRLREMEEDESFETHMGEYAAVKPAGGDGGAGDGGKDKKKKKIKKDKKKKKEKKKTFDADKDIDTSEHPNDTPRNSPAKKKKDKASGSVASGEKAAKMIKKRLLATLTATAPKKKA